MEMFENDHALWARRKEEKDLSDFINCISQIEVDISIIMSEFVTSNKNSEENGGYAIQGMQHSFSYMNDLFHNIKKIRKDLDRSYIRPDELETLEIDWARFRKNIIQTLNYPQDERSEKINLGN
ncbi:hypothetical protein ACFL1Z_03740 [Thermodesulfobacteriota bacterium]